MGLFSFLKRKKGPEPTISERVEKIVKEAHVDTAREEIKRQRKALREERAAERKQRQEERHQQEVKKALARAKKQAERNEHEAEVRKVQRDKEKARLKEERERLNLRRERERLEAQKHTKPRDTRKRALSGKRYRKAKIITRIPKAQYTVMEMVINTDGSQRLLQHHFQNVSMAQRASRMIAQGGGTAIIYGPKGGKVATIKPKTQRITTPNPKISPLYPRITPRTPRITPRIPRLQ